MITLGIIGVVAALTMPSLIANYQKKVWINQLKKTYSMWQQAFQTILITEEVEKLSDSSIARYHCASTTLRCTQFISAMQKYIKIQRGSKPEPLEYRAENTYLIKMYDGSFLREYVFFNQIEQPYSICELIHTLGGHVCNLAGYMVIDVNGYKKPNEWGKDIFRFDFTNEGKLYPRGGKELAIYVRQTGLSNNNWYWKKSTFEAGCSDSDKNNRQGCAGRIMEEGWEMNY